MPGGAVMLDPFARDMQVPDLAEAGHLEHDVRMLQGMPRVNLLLIGSDDLVWRTIGTQLSLRSPIASWRPGESLALPDVSAVATLILNGVDHLTGAEQVRLLTWLDRAVGRTQVVCTATMSLLPLLEAGSFVNALYYRLNTVCLDLTS
jgi:hypothetical protein